MSTMHKFLDLRRRTLSVKWYQARQMRVCYLFLLPFAARGEPKAKSPSSPVPPEVSLQLQAHPKIATVGDPIRIPVSYTHLTLPTNSPV